MRGVLLVLFLAVSAAAAVRVTAPVVVAGSVAPGGRDVLLLKLKIENTGAGQARISGITLSYTGTSESDIAPGSLALYRDSDGNWQTDDRARLDGSPVFENGKAVFSGFNVVVASATATYLFVAAAVSTKTFEGNRIDAAIKDPGDIVLSVVSPAVSFPLDSISDTNPYIVEITATKISVESWETNPAAGRPAFCVARCHDAYGNTDGNWTGSALVLEPVPGAEPGISPKGNAPAYTGSGDWLSSDGGGRRCSYLLYKAETGRRIRLRDTVLGSVESGSINVVASTSVAGYEAAGPSIVKVGEKADYLVKAVDEWGNFMPAFNGVADVSCSEPCAAVSSSLTFAAGVSTASFIFHSSGDKTLAFGNAGAPCSIIVHVDGLPSPSCFSLVVPPRVCAGKEFDAEITVCDGDGATFRDYNGVVNLSVNPPARITPSVADVAGGVWRGKLIVSGESLENVITLSGKNLPVFTSQKIAVDVENFVKAIAYPTVFSPAHETLKIRYFLQTDGDVTVRIYNAVMDRVQEIEFTSGSVGGRQGLNVIEWDGRGGDGNVKGHSGAYHIEIIKMSGSEWTAAIIRNY
ncbi:MAG: hypothetical protein A2219_03130 [Elusimicrobia bacterium RIFOXYA2_FULL_50_26]|nr:MAG: hypothetical protein A2219_03130 [Elusimicrobia bacterium RIFOXYA2_FULL_50_26]